VVGDGCTTIPNILSCWILIQQNIHDNFQAYFLKMKVNFISTVITMVCSMHLNRDKFLTQVSADFKNY